MTRALPPFAWGPAVLISLLVHAAMLWVLQNAIAPDPIRPPAQIATRLNLSSLDVPAQRAEEAPAEGEPVEGTAAGGERIGVRQVPTSRARPVEAVGQAVVASAAPAIVATATAAPSATVAAAQSSGATLSPAPPAAATVAASAASATALESARPDPAVADARPPDAARLDPSTAQAVAVVAAILAQPATAAVRPPATALAATLSPAAALSPAPPPAAALAASIASATALQSARPDLAVADARPPDAARLDSSTAQAVALVAAIPARPATAPVRPPATALASRAPLGTALAAIAGPANEVAATAPTGNALAARAPVGTTLAAAVAAAPAARPVAVPAVAAASRRPQSVPVAAGAADRVAGRLRPAAFANAAVTASAALAWTGGADAVLDERSLSAIQSFMRPGDVAASGAYAGSVRDGIGDALAKFPCSRMQAAFRPETGGLEIRGHVPDEGLRVEVVSMLTETVGGSIPVGGSLIVLPEPQCGVLGRVEAMGLPQSSDQTDDPLVVGREAQVATRRLEDGSPLVLALQAPDFDAHVYIDYFDGGGKVYHLLPNESATDNVFAADAPFSIGDGKLGITATIAPPFGQDLAVVFGSSHPLYEGARPLDEDADDYLAWLYARIAELARTEPGFRGEWVYQLVITGPRGAFAPG